MENLKRARYEALGCKKVLGERKTRTYRDRMIYLLGYKKYDEVKELMLEMSCAAQQPSQILTMLYEDFDKHKNLMYEFISALLEKNKSEE